MNNGKVVLVSGGSRGLGKAIVEYLLQQEYTVCTLSRSKTEYIDNLLNSKQSAQRFYWECIDVNDTDALKKYVHTIYKKYGRIDGLVNNAGANLDKLIAMTTKDEVQNILNLNVFSTILLTNCVTRIMLQQNYGSIVNISSIIGTRGFKGTSVYSASKAALDGFSRSLARELGGRGIRVNSVAPGFIDTDMTKGMAEEKKAQIIRRTPLGRLGKVEDVTGVVAFLLSEQARFITGQTLVVDGGLTC
jgi:3-oxoacyl-[acyl-carrier protein] reductase